MLRIITNCPSKKLNLELKKNFRKIDMVLPSSKRGKLLGYKLMDFDEANTPNIW